MNARYRGSNEDKKQQKPDHNTAIATSNFDSIRSEMNSKYGGMIVAKDENKKLDCGHMRESA